MNYELHTVRMICNSFLFVIYYIVSSMNDYRDTGIYKIMTTRFLRRDMMCHVHCSQTLVLTAYCADSQASYSSESASTVARQSANSSIEFFKKTKQVKQDSHRTFSFDLLKTSRNAHTGREKLFALLIYHIVPDSG